MRGLVFPCRGSFQGVVSTMLTVGHRVARPVAITALNVLNYFAETGLMLCGTPSLLCSGHVALWLRGSGVGVHDDGAVAYACMHPLGQRKNCFVVCELYLRLLLGLVRLLTVRIL